ncbi:MULTISPECIES: phosphonate ABC transporter, permease protein PhnE [unclassified Chelatococcus]|uniref:phosphonate ABC transporter, permease protein PhnE n=1 Tax=unclassified Chelatococcus TaxID=2638111 RepID=UPI001BD0D029|nr:MULTISPECIES: phosphonate ABC transporter, permease protein PhnE [unclassified Chelatococcus]MBS7696127.1 phosphonate ABC transporter, permease protein PhnE [Chelatococcus sp. YT9]MBX3557846.1 phosphonate ABC transporter, permease protein PhnE [Chelatococcus sp.]
MTASVPTLPPAQSQALALRYDQEVANRRRRVLLGIAIFIAAMVTSGWMTEVDLGKLFQNIGAFASYIVRLGHLSNGDPVWTDFNEWFWGLGKWARLLGETLIIAYLGTALGAICAFILSFPAALNLTPSPRVRFVARRFLEFCRSVPEIVFALVFVIAFGLGPIPGVLALAIHGTGALGKLFSEIVENIDMAPVEGIRATGAGRVAVIRFAVLPQVLSGFVSYALLRFEINVRSAAVMGFVGAGGIGQDLLEAIRKFYYSDVSAILILIIITVMIIDMITERVRHALTGMPS